MFKNLIALMALVFSLNTIAYTHYQPEILPHILKQVRKSEKPVVLFDIDDTLTDTRDRTLSILQEFISEPEIIEEYSSEVDTMKDLSLKSVFFEVEDTFDFLKINNPEFRKTAKEYWLKRFFSNEYVSIDREIPGAKDYLNELQSEGAKIVYLTGRDEPRMKQGTIAGLRRNGFPLDSHTRLLMKPNKELPDLEYKKKAFEEVAAMGEVIAVFENEPANINAMHAYFTHATAVFVDTQHSKKPIVPENGIVWIGNYK